MEQVTQFKLHRSIPGIDRGQVRGTFSVSNRLYDFWYDPETKDVSLIRNTSPRAWSQVPPDRMTAARDFVREQLKHVSPPSMAERASWESSLERLSVSLRNDPK